MSPITISEKETREIRRIAVKFKHFKNEMVELLERISKKRYDSARRTILCRGISDIIQEKAGSAKLPEFKEASNELFDFIEAYSFKNGVLELLRVQILLQ